MVKRPEEIKEAEDNTNKEHCLIHCYQALSSTVGKHTVLEYCDISHDTIIGNNSILSNVALPVGSHIPDNTFMTTVCVTLNGTSGLFVSVIFGIGDNVKKTTSVSEIAKLTYFGMPLDTAMKLLGVTQVSSMVLNSVLRVVCVQLCVRIHKEKIHFCVPSYISNFP